MNKNKDIVGCIETIESSYGETIIVRTPGIDIWFSQKDLDTLVAFAKGKRDRERVTHLTGVHCVCADGCDCRVKKEG